MQPQAAAMLVVVAMWAMLLKLPLETAIVEPGLKPNQPSHRMKTPKPAIGSECPGMALALPSLLNLPMRGPSIAAPIKASQPPVE